ncbi:MAG: DNA polymerase I [Candidatus Marinimicrobia bacterium]|nr:DNA polymerase I [Candidatus Neomarinimicrobiota bacterium]
MNKLFIIDGMAIAYRAHFALIRNPLVTSDGRHISAAYGFLNALLKIVKDESPDYLAVAFDSKEKTFRHKKYPDYKATREKMPFEMRPQIQWIKDILLAMNIPIIEIPGFEADDIIGTLARRAESDHIDTYMVSGDKDFMQLVNDHIFLYAPATGKRPLTIYDKAGVEEKWGVPSENIIDLLGLMGDSSDNIPGIKGVGEKTAVKYLQKYGSMDALLEAAGDIPNEKQREKLLEGADMARLSRELATIDVNVPMKTEWRDMVVNHEYETQELKEKLQDLELYKFIRDLGLESGEGVAERKREEEKKKGTIEMEIVDGRQSTVEKNTKQKYVCCDTLEKVKELARKLKKQTVFALDTETDGIDPVTAPLVGLSFAFTPWEAYYIPYTSEYLDILKPVLTNEKIMKIGQHIKFDMIVLQQHGAIVNGKLFDTMLAAYLLNPDYNSYKLDLLSERYLHYRMQPITDLIGEKKSQQIPMSEVDLDKITFYAAEDADITFQLYGVFSKKLEEASLLQVLENIEVPLIPVLKDMEMDGVYLDLPFLKNMSSHIGQKMTRTMEEIYDLAGGVFNINSPKQLGQILFDKLSLPHARKTKTGYSTDVTVLEKLKNEHPLPEKILEFRMLTKLRSTYVDAMPALVNPKTHRVHGSFNQTVAATGRLSSSNPNFQNIPIRTEMGREIRKAFCPQEKDYYILSADYSQVELRIMAHLSRDPNLVEAFKQDADIHTHTAATVFNIKQKDVTPDMRRTAKVINFGIMYGAGAHRISQELNIPHGDAGAIIKAYFERYTGVKEYMDQTIAECKERGFVATTFGRKRPIQDINSENRNLQEAAKRAAINMPVQGTAADIIKIAMIRMHDWMKKEKLRSKMILQVHDELVFEVHPDELELMKEHVPVIMESAAELIVPLKVDVGVGKDWFEAH